MRFKKCDRCGKRNDRKGSWNKVLRLNVMIHFPYYDYEGFDLCISCLNEFEDYVNTFLNNKEKK